MSSKTRKTRIVCISDTHNNTPKLPAGDVLIHAGDLTNQGSYAELKKTVEWIEKSDFEAKIVVGGTLVPLPLPCTISIVSQMVNSHSSMLTPFAQETTTQPSTHPSSTVPLINSNGQLLKTQRHAVPSSSTHSLSRIWRTKPQHSTSRKRTHTSKSTAARTHLDGAGGRFSIGGRMRRSKCGRIRG
jgi:hypothetical protein